MICYTINNSLSIDEVEINFKVKASAVQKHFDALIEKGVIRRMGPTRTVSGKFLLIFNLFYTQSSLV